MAERPTCKTCPYWDEDKRSYGDIGECRRYPPQLIPESVSVGQRKAPSGDIYHDVNPDQLFPGVFGRDDWCGEHPDFPAYIAARKAEGGGNVQEV
jgi:hypothetical protein